LSVEEVEVTRKVTARSKPDEVARLFEESVLLYLRLNAWAARFYGKGQLSGPRRTVLVSLERSGPQTVAQMARRRSQSRQRFQPLVDALVADGLLEAVANPAHRQSPLIELTARGRKMVDRIHKIEGMWRSRLKFTHPVRQVSQSIEVVRAIRLELERLLAEHSVRGNVTSLNRAKIRRHHLPRKVAHRKKSD
jgi:DNA-binding MarR family transcriptional regulator